MAKGLMCIYWSGIHNTHNLFSSPDVLVVLVFVFNVSAFGRSFNASSLPSPSTDTKLSYISWFYIEGDWF